MSNYKNYRQKVSLIYKYLYNLEERLASDKLERDSYYKIRAKYKDEVDYLEDMILLIRLRQVQEIRKDIFNLLELIDNDYQK